MHLSKRQSSCSRTPGAGCYAFSRTDLVACLAAVSLLGLIEGAAISNTKSRGDAAACFLNLRQLSQAWIQYADDRGGVLIGNFDGGGVQSLSNSNRTWVLGWLDFMEGLPSRANTNTLLLTQYSPLAPYLAHEARPFKCPADTSLSRGTIGLPRVRSVSLNAYIGERSAPFSSGYHQFRKISELASASMLPAETYLFIDEHEGSINDGWFIVGMDGYDPRYPNNYRIIDYPAAWHDRGANLSFVDGHVETWRWRDLRTTPSVRPGTLMALGVQSPQNEDVARLQHASTRRILPTRRNP